MKYFSVIIGEGCNAKCPFCIAPPVMKNSGQLNIEGLQAAHETAKKLNIDTISISGGGEPLMLKLKQPEVWTTLDNIVSQYNKRDLHTNYSFIPKDTNLFPLYNYVTVSLWPTKELNKGYMGYNRFDKTVELIKRDSGKANFRLSAILGKDWAKSCSDIENYLDFAKSLGVKAVTFRTFQKEDHEDLDWIDERYTDGRYLEEAFAQKYNKINTSLRDLNVYDYYGIKVMFYRYAREYNTEDKDFLYYRPSTIDGKYDLYTDYSDDNKKFILQK